CFFVRTVVDVLESTDRGDTNTNAVCAPLITNSIHHFKHQTRAVFNAAAVLVGTLVGRRGQELMQQVTVRRVQLNQVEARFTGVGDGLTEIIHDTRDLVQLQRAWRGGVDADRITVFIAQGSAGIGVQGRGRNRRLTARLDAAV